jgi:hypothetical protein
MLELKNLPLLRRGEMRKMNDTGNWGGLPIEFGTLTERRNCRCHEKLQLVT